MADSETRKWSGRSSAGSMASNGLRFLMRYTPIRVSYLLLYAVVPFYMLFAREGYNSIYRFFRRRFSLSPWRAFVWTYRNHYIFGQTLLDKFAFFAGKRSFLTFEIEGKELMHNAFTQEQGTLLASAHVGSFEISGYFLKSTGKPINSLVFGGEERVVQANRQRVLDEQNVKLIAVGDDMSHIFALSVAAGQREIISMACDRYFPGAKSAEVDFFGIRTRFPVGAFHIACRYELDVLSIFVVKVRRGAYRAIVRPVAGNTPIELAQNYAIQLEAIVREYPLQWFNFYDFFDGK